jgi:hypothetical protein
MTTRYTAQHTTLNGIVEVYRNFEAEFNNGYMVILTHCIGSYNEYINMIKSVELMKCHVTLPKLYT